MIKTLVIGDIHGRNIWEKIIDSQKTFPNKIIFLGDYHDPYKSEKISLEKSIDNFLKIIEFKKAYPDETELLLGNHDTNYIYETDITTRYDVSNYKIIEYIFKENKKLFQYAYKIDNHLFTHAGVSSSWLKYYNNDLIKAGLNPDLSNIGDLINKLGKNKIGKYIINSIGQSRKGCGFGGITWADIKETYNNLPLNLHQYVAHSKVEKIKKYPKNKNCSITYIDVLWNNTLKLNKKYLLLEL